LAPGAVLDLPPQGSDNPCFHLPYLNLTTMKYSKSSTELRCDIQGNKVALAVMFTCPSNPGNINQLCVIPW
jgi:hypothetical protein